MINRFIAYYLQYETYNKSFPAAKCERMSCSFLLPYHPSTVSGLGNYLKKQNTRYSKLLKILTFDAMFKPSPITELKFKLSFDEW
jgi:hypothetical protein